MLSAIVEAMFPATSRSWWISAVASTQVSVPRRVERSHHDVTAGTANRAAMSAKMAANEPTPPRGGRPLRGGPAATGGTELVAGTRSSGVGAVAAPMAEDGAGKDWPTWDAPRKEAG